MLQLKTIFIILSVVLLLAACGAPIGQLMPVLRVAQPGAIAAVSPTAPTVASVAQSTNDTLSNCPITRPQNPVFVPPPPWPPKAPYGEFWYGTEALWTAVRPEGIWEGLPHNPEGYTQKVWFWRKGYGGGDALTSQLTVMGKRLNGSAPPLVASSATNGYHPDFNWAMLVGVDVPTLGCWEITGHLQGEQLSFVVWVAP